jgi:hypothetical protein
MTPSNVRSLALENLKLGIAAVTESVGGAMIEACMVCFEDQGHSSGVELQVMGDYDEVFSVTWQGAVTDQTRRTW